MYNVKVGYVHEGPNKESEIDKSLGDLEKQIKDSRTSMDTMIGIAQRAIELARYAYSSSYASQLQEIIKMRTITTPKQSSIPTKPPVPEPRPQSPQSQLQAKLQASRRTELLKRIFRQN